MSQTVSVGRIVTYVLTDADADLINQRATLANPAQAGDEYPALVVRVFGPPLANLQVFYDGEGSYWATSRTEGDTQGTWHWPARV
jgi:hypothetical protein